MLLRSTIVCAILGLAAKQAIAAAVDTPRDVEARDQMGILIATDPVFACNCPNNCQHRAGSSCKFYSGPSDTSKVISGICYNINGQLKCQ